MADLKTNDQPSTSTGSSTAGLSAVVLAAGKGTRMQSDLPKVCHLVGDRPMVCAVVDACLEAGCDRVVAVVGYKQELVRQALAGYGDVVEFVVQEEQLGTGHAVMSARSAYESVLAASEGDSEQRHDVFVLAGDGPLIRPTTLKTLLARHRDAGAAAALATSVIEDPSGYGRIVRDAKGHFERIVEQKNATEAELAIKEVNPSYYCFSAVHLFSALERVQRNELTGEYYITDVPELLLGAGESVEVIDAVPAEDILSINTLEHLAEVDAIYRGRLAATTEEVN